MGRSDNNTKKKGIRAAVIAVLIVAAAVGALTATHTLVWFRHGVHLKNTAAISHRLEAGETAKLAFLPNLSAADFKDSTNYEELYVWARNHPEVEVRYDIIFPEGVSYDPQTHTADLTVLDRSGVYDSMQKNVGFVLGLAGIRADFSEWTYEQMDEFAQNFPELRIEGVKDLGQVSAEEFAAYRKILPDVDYTGEVMLGNTAVPIKTESAVLPGLDEAGLKDLSAAADYMPSLKSVDFGGDTEGHAMLPQVYAFLKAHPDIKVDYKFTVFDRTPGIHDIKLDLNHRKMTDQGAEVREVIACMPELKWLDMDSCGVDDEHMAAIRDEYPDVKVVWRIWFGPKKTYSVRTNVIRILASAPESAGSLTQASTQSLKYCTDVKYLDIGHNEYLYNIDFVRYMPDLEVFIVMDGTISDISVLAGCRHMEYLELFTNRITDLTPLSELHELKHLNICWNRKLADISPIYGLDLERLWIGCLTNVPKEQIEKYRELHPNCVVNDEVLDSHTDWRWDEDRNYYPRYALLRQQLGYHYPEGGTDYVFYWMDPLYEPHDDSITDPLCPY